MIMFFFFNSYSLANNECDYYLNFSEIEQGIAKAYDPTWDLNQILADEADLHDILELFESIARLPNPDDLGMEDSQVVEDEVLALMEEFTDYSYESMFGNSSNDEDMEYFDILLKRRLSDIMIRTLTAREERVIRLRFFKDLDLDTISLRYGVGRERIRQIEVKALQKLRRSLELELNRKKSALTGLKQIEAMKKLVIEEYEIIVFLVGNFIHKKRVPKKDPKKVVFRKPNPI